MEEPKKEGDGGPPSGEKQPAPAAPPATPPAATQPPVQQAVDATAAIVNDVNAAVQALMRATQAAEASGGQIAPAVVQAMKQTVVAAANVLQQVQGGAQDPNQGTVPPAAAPAAQAPAAPIQAAPAAAPASPVA